MLPNSFFNRSSIVVAKDLIGCYLCTPKGKFMIVETESYEGPRDMASHAFRGVTQRNQPMFGPAGVWYVYFTYGMHYMLNIVCGSAGFPSAVLIRGVEGAIGPGDLPRSSASTKDLIIRRCRKILGSGSKRRGELKGSPKIQLTRK